MSAKCAKENERKNAFKKNAMVILSKCINKKSRGVLKKKTLLFTFQALHQTTRIIQTCVGGEKT